MKAIGTLVVFMFYSFIAFNIFATRFPEPAYLQILEPDYGWLYTGAVYELISSISFGFLVSAIATMFTIRVGYYIQDRRSKKKS